MTFEEALVELQTVVDDLERGDITLDDSLKRYERGVALLKECYGQLKEADAKIRELVGVDEGGKPTFAAFDHVSSDLLAKTKKRKTGGEREA